MRSVTTSSEAQTIALGAEIGAELKGGTVVALEGSLGAGKTTLVKGIAQALGITEPVTSPSFTLIQEYAGTLPLYHMDLYRIDSLEEFELLGAEEFLYAQGVTVIEWSEKISQLLPDFTVSITCSIEPDQTRRITIGENP